MGEVERIAEELRRSLGGEAWHGPSLGELLADVDAAEAAARPLPGAHSIWEIVHHLRVWIEVPRRRLAGERVGDLRAAEDWPPVAEPNAEAWAEARRALDAAHRDLERDILELGDERLGEPVAGSSPDVQGLLYGVVQHHAYHGGQIALLKKALRRGRAGGAD